MSSAPYFLDRIQESSTTTGTGSYTLAGAVTGFRAFSTLADGSRCYYTAQAVDGNGNPSGDWEVGLGTYTLAGTILTRDEILASSNSNNAVNWAAGTKHIFITLPADSVVSRKLPIFPVQPDGLQIVTPSSLWFATSGANVYDIYTVPAGKKAILWSLIGQNLSGTSVSVSMRVKIAGTYYRLSTNLTVNTGNSIGNVNSAGYILEAGETLAFNITGAGTNVINACPFIFEFDDTYPVFSTKTLGLSAGDTTLYTCPADKTAIIIGTPTGAFYPPFQLGASGNCGFVSAVTTTLTAKGYIVPSGGAVGGNRQVSSNVTVASSSGILFSGSGLPLHPGDFLACNLSVGGADVMAGASIIEYPLF